MKKNCILIIAILFTSLSNAQKVKLSDMQGLWVSGLKNFEYRIFVKDTLVSLSFYEIDDISIYYDKVGFVDRNNQALINTYRKVFNLKPNEEVRMVNFDVPEAMNIEIMTEQKNENDYFYYGGTLCSLGIDPEDLPSKVGSRFELINSNVFVYIKVESLPNEYLRALYKKGKNDKKDYLKDFFNMEFKEIKVTKSIIYSTPNKPTKMYLLKGDVVEILQEKDDWLQIRYYGKKTIEGWIKKSDVE